MTRGPFDFQNVRVRRDPFRKSSERQLLFFMGLSEIRDALYELDLLIVLCSDPVLPAHLRRCSHRSFVHCFSSERRTTSQTRSELSDSVVCRGRVLFADDMELGYTLNQQCGTHIFALKAEHEPAPRRLSSLWISGRDVGMICVSLRRISLDSQFLESSGIVNLCDASRWSAFSGSCSAVSLRHTLSELVMNATPIGRTGVAAACSSSCGGNGFTRPTARLHWSAVNSRML